MNHLRDAREQQLITEQELIDAEVIARRALKATTGLILHLESTPDPKPRKKHNIT